MLLFNNINFVFLKTNILLANSSFTVRFDLIKSPPFYEDFKIIVNKYVYYLKKI